MERLQLIIDCDPGVDDALAIILALNHPAIDVLAICSVAGNGHIENTTQNGLKILSLCGREDIPLYQGADASVNGVRPDTVDAFGDDGLGGCADAVKTDKEPEKAACTCDGEGIDSEQIYQLLKALMDKGLLGELLTKCGSRPYQCVTHENGLKVVRGNTVKMDVFDTGDPNATAYFQELVSKEESHISAGFLVIDHSEFAWELTYEEIDYVIEGTLTVTIDGKKYTANAGDVLFVPSGSKVIWGSPDKARVFYATYPANWADLL